MKLAGLARHPTRTIILAYHRVTALSRDPQLLAVQPAHFEGHLEALEALAAIIPLRMTLARGRGPRVAITFDDGYGDNAREALPILESRGTPATLFVTAGLAGTAEEFWWDRLQRVTEVPARSGWLDVVVRDRRLRVNLGSAAGVARAYETLHPRLRRLPVAEINRVLDDVEAQMSPCPPPSASDRAMTLEELTHAADSPLIEVGAHSLTHPLLATLSRTEQQTEIEGSRGRLQQLTGKPVEAFAYPYGTADSFSRTTTGIVRRAGFALACANWPSRVVRRVHRYALPRYLVRDWRPDEFASRVTRWLDG